MVTYTSVATARRFLDRLEAGRLPKRFTTRELYRRGWSGLDDREMVTAALDALTNAGRLAKERIVTRGRPRVEHIIQTQH